jgi:hypothetical protein
LEEPAASIFREKGERNMEAEGFSEMQSS